MPTVNENLRARSVSHAIAIERYKAGVVRRMIAELDRANARIVKLIEARGPDGTMTAYRQEQLLLKIREMTKVAYVKYGEALRGELKELAAYEIDFQVRMIESAIPGTITTFLDFYVPATTTVYSAAMSQPFQGRLLREWYQGLSAKQGVDIKSAIRAGVTNGETVQQIVNRVRGTKANRYRDGVLAMQRRHAEAITRTAVNHTVTRAREQTYKANEDLIKGVQWISTLDDRTTLECMDLDGKVFPVDEGPRPPAHFGCRSSTAPVMKSYRELGIDRDEVPGATRASMNGQVPATQTYGEWLKSQSVAVQNEALGRSRAELFRKGGLTVNKFTDRKGRAYTLDELRKRDASAFEAAGL